MSKGKDTPRFGRITSLPLDVYWRPDSDTHILVAECASEEYAETAIKALNSFAAFEQMREALKVMLYIFDRELPASSIGRKTCDEARAALALADDNGKVVE